MFYDEKHRTETEWWNDAASISIFTPLSWRLIFALQHCRPFGSPNQCPNMIMTTDVMQTSILPWITLMSSLQYRFRNLTRLEMIFQMYSRCGLGIDSTDLRGNSDQSWSNGRKCSCIFSWRHKFQFSIIDSGLANCHHKLECSFDFHNVSALSLHQRFVGRHINNPHNNNFMKPETATVQSTHERSWSRNPQFTVHSSLYMQYSYGVCGGKSWRRASPGWNVRQNVHKI